MYIHKRKDSTKDGRSWVFQIGYKNFEGKNKRYTSRKFKTKKEALEEGAIFMLENKKMIGRKNMKLKELCDVFYDYKKNKVKNTTLYTYIQRRKYFKVLDNIEIGKLKLEDYKLWRQSIDTSNLSYRYKNDIQKFLKEILIFAERWYGYDFRNYYNKFDKFRNPNNLENEAFDFYTYEEFKKFIAVENDLKFKIAFELLYYCGIRRGELLALTWNHIDFDKKELLIKQNLVENRINGGYIITSPKTRSSIRTLPLTDFLLKDLEILFKENINKEKFNNSWYILGNEKYLPITNLMNRKNKNCMNAELKQIRLHDFRHSCASLLISKGNNVSVVSRYLGHSKIDETLNTYTHFFNSDLDRIKELLDSLHK